jgi:hypothetical protein
MPNLEESAVLIINRLVQANASQPQCQVCRHKEFTVGPFVALPVATTPTNVSYGPTVVPCVALMCQTCGNTILINLLRLGFTPEEIRDMSDVESTLPDSYRGVL